MPKIKVGDLVESKDAKDNNIYRVLEIDFYGKVCKVKPTNVWSMPFYIDTKNVRRV